jgi:hypothetical protein
MTLHDIETLDSVETLHSEFDPVTPVTGGYTSDLLSDVMANAETGCLLITIQAHNNTVAVAALAGASGILICNKREIPDDMIESAKREQLALFRTPHNQFEASCMLGRQLEA